MRRFSFATCWQTSFRTAAQSVPPSLPAPPNPLPDLKSKKQSNSRKLHTNNNPPDSREQADSGHDSPITLTKFNAASHDETIGGVHDQVQTTNSQFPLSPPSVAESVTHSEFDGLCDANETRSNDEFTHFQSTASWASQDSLLSALAENQCTTTCENKQLQNVYDDPETERKYTHHMVGEHGNRQHCQSNFSNSTEWEFFSTTEAKRTPLNKRHNFQNVPLDDSSGLSQNHWSAGGHSRAGKVAEVANAWELYFNPSKRHSPYDRKTTSLSYPTPVRQPEDHTGSGTSISQSLSFVALPSSDDRGNATQSSVSNYMMDRLVTASSSGTIVIDDQDDTFEENNELSFVRIGKGRYEGSETNGAVSHLTSTDSIAQMSDCSSATIALSDSKTPIGDEQLESASRTIVSDSELKCNTEALRQEFFCASEMHTNTSPTYRFRSVSTPATSRRPLCITVQRHRISASRSPCLSTSNVQVPSWLSEQESLHNQCYQPIRRRRFESASVYAHTNGTSRRRTQDVSLTNDQPMVKSCIREHTTGEMVGTGFSQGAHSGLRRRVTIHSAHWPSSQTGVAETLLHHSGSSTLNLSNQTDHNGGSNLTFGGSSLIVPKPTPYDHETIAEPRHDSARQQAVQSKTTIKLESRLKDVSGKDTRCRGIHDYLPTRLTCAGSHSPFLPVEKLISLSPAAERYEQHVKAVVAQRQMLKEYMFECPQKSPCMPSPSRKDPLQHRVGTTSATSTPLEVTNGSSTNANDQNGEESIDPDLWQEKLDQIARWQREVNSAIQSGQAEINVCFQPPDATESSRPCSVATPEKDDTLTDNGLAHGENSVSNSESVQFPRPLLVSQAPLCQHDRSPEYDNETPTKLPVMFASQVLDASKFVGKDNLSLDDQFQHRQQNHQLLIPEGQSGRPFYPPFTAVFPIRSCVSGPLVEPLRDSIHENVPTRQHGPSCQTADRTNRCQPPTTQPIVQRLPYDVQRKGSPLLNGWQKIGQPTSPFNEPFQFVCRPVLPVQSAHQAKITLADSLFGTKQLPAFGMIASPPNLNRPTVMATNPTIQLPSPNGPSVVGATVIKGKNDRSHIYEGVEYWHEWDNNTNTQWTRVPFRSNQVIDNSDYASALSRRSPSMDKQMDGSRHRTVTRVQLTGARPPLPSAVSTSQWSQCTPNPTEHFQCATTTKARTNFTARRASTVSPVRHQPEATAVESLHNSQVTQTSGFASNGSINGAVEGVGGGILGKSASGVSSIERRNCVPSKNIAHTHSHERADKSQTQPNYLQDSNATAMLGQQHQQLCPSATEKPSRINIRIPPQRKFLLGRVASTDDICIETEIPFAFSIAATENEICITKEATANNLKQTAAAVDQGKIARRIPVSLRLTFGSEMNLAVRDEKELNLIQEEPYRSTYHIDLPDARITQPGRVTLRKNPANRSTSFRYSLPCILSRGDEIHLAGAVS